MPDSEFQDICVNKHGHNEISARANLDTATRKLRDRSKIRVYVALYAGATCDEIEQGLGLSHQTASARCSEMLANGTLTWEGKRRTRSGSWARVMRIPKETA